MPTTSPRARPRATSTRRSHRITRRCREPDTKDTTARARASKQEPTDTNQDTKHFAHFARPRPRSQKPGRSSAATTSPALYLGRGRRGHRMTSPGGQNHTMPRPPRRRCPHQGCANAQPCPNHNPKSQRQSNYAAFYASPEWKRMRATVLDQERYCPGWPADHPIRCHQPTKQVDHVIALEDGGPPLQRSNLVALCPPCHGRKTADEVARRRTARAKVKPTD